MAWIEVDVDFESLVISLTSAMNSRELTQFILDLDANRADLEFTINLRDKLNEVIDEEISAR